MFPTSPFEGLRRTWGLALLAGWLAWAPQGRTEDNPRAVADARAAIERFLTKASDYGFAAAVWVDDDIEWSQQWGKRNREKNLAVTSSTLFRIGSVTKVITAMTLASMVEKGEVAWDCTLAECLPGAPKSYRPITLRMLASHTSGVRHYDRSRMQEEFLTRKHCDDHATGMAYFVNDPLVNSPGEKFLYTTYGYTVLGAAMEYKARVPMIQLMRSRVLAPAGMTNTFAEHSETFEGELAVPYASSPEHEFEGPVPPVDNSCKLAGGGLVSTPVDLARFLGSVATDRIVSESTLTEMLPTPKIAHDARTVGGIGWRISKDAKGRRYIHHGGSAAGGRAFVLLYPVERVGVAMCMNLASHQVKFAEDLALEVAAGFLVD